MAKSNYLGQIKLRMDQIQKEFSALTEAYQLLSAVGTGRGRKAKLPTLSELSELASPKVKKTGKRGRPPGAKNKPGSKKPGPKTSSSKAAPAEVEKPAPTKVAKAKPTVAKTPGKRGRKPGKKVAKVEAASKPAVVKASTPAKTAKPVKSAKPAKAPKAAKSTGKRGRIPNLSEKIQEIVGKSGRFVTNSQITDKLKSLYPTKSRSDLGKYISVILATMKNRGELGVVTKDAKGNKMRSGLWGLMTWFDNGKPKNDFLK